MQVSRAARDGAVVELSPRLRRQLLGYAMRGVRRGGRGFAWLFEVKSREQTARRLSISAILRDGKAGESVAQGDRHTGDFPSRPRCPA